MRKWLIVVVVFTILGVLQLCFVPMMRLDYTEEIGSEFDGTTFRVFFDGRVKYTLVIENVSQTVVFGSFFWKDLLGVYYPPYILALSIFGFVLFSATTLYKIINEKEDRRISSAIMIAGGIIGLVGAILYRDFGYALMNALAQPEPNFYYGYYINIGFFVICIVIAIIFQVLSFFKPFSEEKDLFDEPEKLRDLLSNKK
ncbi:MAG: hypothetical protein ACFFDW_02885 [Candidatus Thorarchaeota archaeon]